MGLRELELLQMILPVPEGPPEHLPRRPRGPRARRVPGGRRQRERPRVVPGGGLGDTDRYAAVAHHPETADAIAALRASEQFTIEGEERTESVPFEQSVDEYLEFLHSTSTLARAQLGRRAEAFDDEVRAVFARHGIERLRYGVVGIVTWALPRRRPRAPHRWCLAYSGRGEYKHYP